MLSLARFLNTQRVLVSLFSEDFRSEIWHWLIILCCGSCGPTQRNAGRSLPSRSKMVQTVQNGPKRSKTVQNGPKWSKTVQNGPKWSKTVQKVQNGPKCKNGPDLSDMVQNGPSFPYAFLILKFQKNTFFWDTLYLLLTTHFCSVYLITVAFNDEDWFSKVIQTVADVGVSALKRVGKSSVTFNSLAA